MTSDIAIPEGVLVHPITGEAKTLAEIDNAELAEGIRQMDELNAQLQEARKRLATEAWARKNRNQPVSGVEVSRSRNWNARNAKNVLDRLIENGDVPEECRAYVYPVESDKASGRDLQRLADALVSEGKVEAARMLLTARTESIRAKVEAPES